MTHPPQAAADTTALVPVSGALTTTTSLDLGDHTSREEWERVGKVLGELGRAHQWWLGDWIRFGERKYGETYEAAMAITGLEYQALANYAWVAGEVSTRVESLSWSHHREVAALDPADHATWLERAEAENWSVRDLKQQIRARKATNPPALPEGQYRCIVADPPWYVEKIERDVRPKQGAGLDYPTMTVDEIAAMSISEIAAPDAHLYLWTTHRYLHDAFDIATAWGFTYQCLMTWNKNVGITPFSWMYDTEHVLFCKRGSLPLDQLGMRLSFAAPVTRHSEKPDVFYERVVSASPGPRLELFARQPRDGFVVWGNEVAA